MIQLTNVSVTFGNNIVLKNLSCTIEDGDFIVVVGTNGAGKSTFFDVIAGKVKPDSGSIMLDNVDITNLDELERASFVTRLFQNPQLNCVGSMTVAQNLAMALYSRRSATLRNGMAGLPQDRIIKMLEPIMSSPATIAQTRMGSLSGGQRQLISFVMATSLIPKILLLDEPTAALDPQAATTLLKFATQFIKQHKVTTLLITHDPDIALSIGNKIWVLENGVITRQYNEEDKKGLRAEDLIGKIRFL